MLQHYTQDIILLIVISVGFSIIEYVYEVQHMECSMSQKIQYMTIDLVHCFIYVLMFYLAINTSGNLIQCLLMNTLYFIIIACFYYYKRCILTIMSENCVESDTVKGWVHPLGRLYNLFVGKYERNQGTSEMWMNSNKPVILSVLAVNLFCLSKWYLRQIE